MHSCFCDSILITLHKKFEDDVLNDNNPKRNALLFLD